MKAKRTHWLLRWLGCIDERDSFVKIVSWMPTVSFHPAWRGIEWPTYIADRHGLRETRTPLWSMRDLWLRKPWRFMCLRHLRHRGGFRR